MSTDEFERGAGETVEQVAELPAGERFAAAARGSANPAALAWLAEGLRLDAAASVLDIGTGMGGPAGWLTERYGCRVVGVEPAHAAARAAATLFDVPVAQGGAVALPVRTDAFDAALLLGVLSVVDDPEATLVEARRVARSLAVLEWCAQGADDVSAGGSRFPTETSLLALLDAAGWTVQQSSALQLDAPHVWESAAEAVEAPPDPDEQEVVAAIERGELAPFLAVALR